MKKKTLREKIIDAAIILFEKHGYHGVSIEQIAEESGTSKGGFYYNFSSKDDLLYQIQDNLISIVLEKTKLAYDHFDTPVSRLCEILSLTKIFDVYKPHITVFYQESNYLKGELISKIEDKRDEYRKILLNVIKEGQENGDFRSEVSPEVTTMAIIGMMNWTYKWFNPNGALSIGSISHQYTDIILHSLLTEKGMKDPTTHHFLLKNLVK